MERRSAAPLPKLILLLLTTCFLVTGLSRQANAWFWQNGPLVTINDEVYSADDYRGWWKNWQEPDMALPTTPDDFIDWQLMAQEGTRMQLDQDLGYQRKLQIFVKVRSLMLFKYDEVDSKINLSKKEIWAYYEQNYCPLWQVGVFFFTSEKEASKNAAMLRDGSLTFEALKAITRKEDGPLFSEKKWLRRPQIKEDWFASLDGQPVGFITSPMARGEHFILLCLLDRQEANEKDFANVDQTIERKLRKQRSGELTVKLVERLKKKYEVEINQDILASIGTTPLTMQEAEKDVILTNKENIKAGALQALIAKERQFRKQYKFKQEGDDILKNRVVEGMLGQTLISWEALARHYETREPFKTTYDFYCRHQLAKGISTRFIAPKAKLDEGEVLAYYEQNQAQYTNAEVYSFILVEGEKELTTTIQNEINLGEDFTTAINRHFPSGLEVTHLPKNHIDAELKQVLLPLQKGEISQPFKYKQGTAIVKLVNNKVAMPIPFKQIEDELTQKLRKEKFTTSRRDFLAILKDKSTITVNQKVWDKLHKEFLKDNDSKETK